MLHSACILVSVLPEMLTPPDKTFHCLNCLPEGGVPGVSVTTAPVGPERSEAVPPATVTV